MARPKGSVGRKTQVIREAVLQAFDKLGGVKWLVQFGQNNPIQFVQLLGRLIPREVQLSVDPSVPPPPSLSDPSVLAAALALDQVADEVSHAASAGPSHPPALPLGPVPSPDPKAPAAPADQAAHAP